MKINVHLLTHACQWFADMEEIMADAYYGYAERPGRRK